MYIQKTLFESTKYHKYIFTLYDYIDSNSLKTEIKGYIKFIICFEDLDMTITDFNIDFENKGYGTILLNESIDKIKKNYSNIKIIKLDDMSVRYRKSNNIYIKFGFKYIDDYGPEMIYYL